MTLYFHDPAMTRKFIRLCQGRGFKGSLKRAGRKEIVTVKVRGKEQKDLVAAWADLSCEKIEPGKYQPALKLNLQTRSQRR